MNTQTAPGATHVLSFQAIHSNRRLEFPCDAAGVVLLDLLSERARNNYFLARVTQGRDYLAPEVRKTVQ